MVMRLPIRADNQPHASRERSMAILLVMWRTPPAAIPPSSMGKFKLLPMATIIMGMESEQTEYMANAENAAKSYLPRCNFLFIGKPCLQKFVL